MSEVAARVQLLVKNWFFGRNGVALDFETTGNVFGGKDSLRVTVGVLWSAKTQCLHAYREEHLGLLAIVLDSADTILIHNKAFDIEVLTLYFPTARVRAWDRKVIDLFEIVKHYEGTWAGLGAICDVNNKPTKSGSGLAAIKQWFDGEFKELDEYCAKDVIIMVIVMHELDSIYYCQKRYDGTRKVSRHIGMGIMNKRTQHIVLTPHAFPPGFHDDCPCIHKIKRARLEADSELVVSD